VAAQFDVYNGCKAMKINLFFVIKMKKTAGGIEVTKCASSENDKNVYIDISQYTHGTECGTSCFSSSVIAVRIAFPK
jgi:hypothetical protein